jgi:hypothetical protein
MANEWSGLELECQVPQLVPYGPDYTNNNYRACTVISSQGSIISGDAYIAAQYNHSRSHIWRGFGVVVAFWVFFIFLTTLGFIREYESGGSSLIFKRNSSSMVAVPDEENVQNKDIVEKVPRGPQRKILLRPPLISRLSLGKIWTIMFATKARKSSFSARFVVMQSQVTFLL